MKRIRYFYYYNWEVSMAVAKASAKRSGKNYVDFSEKMT
jgi:hypothetical protein